MTFLVDLIIRSPVRDLVAVQPAIAIFQAFYGIVRLSSSTISALFVDDPELKLIDFI